jgi:hypothetical protein
MLNGGKVMSEQPCYVAVRDGVLNHMAHHRGQLTVYLRLNEEKVPAIYGPSADEGRWWSTAFILALECGSERNESYRGTEGNSIGCNPSQRGRREVVAKPRSARVPSPNKNRVEGSGTVVPLDDPCIETKPKINVEPNPAGPLKVIVAGKVRLLICGPPRVVLAPLPPTIEHPLNSDAAPPLIWHWALLAIPVLFCPVLVSEKEKVLPILLNTTYFCVPAPILLGALSRTRRALRL